MVVGLMVVGLESLSVMVARSFVSDVVFYISLFLSRLRPDRFQVGQTPGFRSLADFSICILYY
jgi:hypothetical protein